MTSEEFFKLIQKPDGLAKRTPDGYIGNPADYDVEEGNAIFEGGAVRSAATIESYLKGTYKLPDNFKPYKPEDEGKVKQ